MKIWHDDVRPRPSEDWILCRDNLAAIKALIMHAENVTEISLDHDLGGDPADGIFVAGASPAGDGLDLVIAMCALRLVPPRVTVHSWNHSRARHMREHLMRYAPEGTLIVVAPYAVPA